MRKTFLTIAISLCVTLFVAADIKFDELDFCRTVIAAEKIPAVNKLGNDLVVATQDGRVIRLSPESNKIIWEKKLGAFIAGIATGGNCVSVALQDENNTFCLLNIKTGKLAASHELPCLLRSAGAATDGSKFFAGMENGKIAVLNPTLKTVNYWIFPKRHKGHVIPVAMRMLSGDFQKNGKWSLAVLGGGLNASDLVVFSSSGAIVDSSVLLNNKGYRHAENYRLSDIGDGKIAALAVNRIIVRDVASRKTLAKKTISPHWVIQSMAVTDWNKNGKKELFVNKNTHLFRISLPDMKVVEKYDIRQPFYTLTAFNDGNGDVVIFGGSRSARDKHIYYFGRKRGQELHALSNTELFSVKEPVFKKTPSNTLPWKRKVHLLFQIENPKLNDVDICIAEFRNLYRYYQRLGDENIDVELYFGAQTAKRYRKYYSNLKKIFIRLEKENIPFYFSPVHQNSGEARVETVTALLDLAPSACKGLVSGEIGGIYHSAGDNGFAYIIKLMDDLKRRGKKLLNIDHYDPWMAYPCNRKLYDSFFSLRYRDVLVPFRGGNDRGMIDMDLNALLGLVYSGRVAEWGVSIQSWRHFECSNGAYDHKTFPRDLSFRISLAMLSMGATYLQYEPLECASEEFFKLLKNKTIGPVAPEDMASMSNIGFLIDPVADSELRKYVFSRIQEGGRDGFLQFDWFSKSVKPNYFSAIAYGSRRYIDGWLPRNKYGLITFYPQYQRKDLPKFVDKVFTTDLKTISNNERKMTPQKFSPYFERLLQASAAKLPVTADNVFIATHRRSDGFLIYLIDPEFTAPRSFQTTLKIQIPTPYELTDALTGKKLSPIGNSLKLKIPAGSFRLIHLKKLDISNARDNNQK